MLTDFSIEDIDHIEIFVTDREKAAKWYMKIFGLKAIKELEAWAKIGPLFVGTEDRSVTLAIMNGKKSNDGSINRMAFRTTGEKFMDFLNRVDDMELFFLRENVTKEQVVDHDLSYSIYFDDPDGNKLELTCYDHDYLKSKIKFARRFD
ncbi:MAG: hypothetical protein GKS07_04685 [Nitrosopumilus sp.]|nr:MAG: hypothetical protein GKS07_04685 [Nitrosopumilus sp.]